ILFESSVCHLSQATDKSPAAAQFADRQHQLVAAFLQRKINRVVFRIDDAQKPGVAKILRAAPAKKNLAVQKHADVVAVAEVELFHLLAIGINRGSRIQDLHSRLRLQAFRKVVSKSDPRMRRRAVSIQNDKSG